MSSKGKEGVVRSGQPSGGWWVAGIILLGVMLHLPCLSWGFFADDYGHQIIMSGVGKHSSLQTWNLYDYGTLPTKEEPTYETGSFPWWTAKDWKGRFFRPVTSLTRWLDYALFGDWAVGHHLMSLAWYVVLLTLLHVLFRAFGLSVKTSMLALLLFATSFSSALPVGWPANRNALMMVLFASASLLVLTYHSTWGRYRVLGLALLLAMMAVLSKESGVASLVLIALYLFLLHRCSTDQTTMRWAVVGICTSLLLSIAFLIAYTKAGYGTNSLFYSVPWENPVAYIERLGLLVTSGVLGLLGLSSVDSVVHHPELIIPVVITAILVLPPLAWVIWREARRHPLAIFFVGWLALTLLPQAAVMPSDRLLFAPSVGSSALLAIFLSHVLFCEGQDKPRRTLRVLGIGIVISACGFSAASKVVQGIIVGRMASDIREIVLTAEVGSPELGRREVFILQSPSVLAAFSVLQTWVIENQDVQVRFWPMQFGGRGVIWTRIDDKSFELQSVDEPFLDSMMETVFRTESSLPALGIKFETALFTVEIIDVNDWGVTKFRVRCRSSLDTPRYRFLISHKGKLVAISPPTVGESIQVETAVSEHWDLR